MPNNFFFYYLLLINAVSQSAVYEYCKRKSNFYEIGYAITWCDAFRKCRDFSNTCGFKTFPVGLDYTKLNTEVNPGIYFTSISNKKNPRRMIFRIWNGLNSLGELSLAKTDKLHWKTKAPNKSTYVSAVVNSQSVTLMEQDEPILATLKIVCQKADTVKERPMGSQKTKYVSHSIKKKYYLPEGTTKQACHKVLDKVASSIRCGMLCQLNENCEAFFYNNATKQCRLSEFMNSLLASKHKTGPWKKFERMTSLSLI